MMLANPSLRVALATTHLPLRAVRRRDHRRRRWSARCASCTRALRAAVRHRLAAHRRARPESACRRRRPSGPRGNRGHRSRCWQRLRDEGMAPRSARCRPTPPSCRRSCAGFDAVLAMYHDQGLPVLKYAGFEQAVNITLGLPYPRVAVDHGTALDLAGTRRRRPVQPVRRRRARAPALPRQREPAHEHFKAPPKKQLGQHFLHDRSVIEQDRAGGRARKPGDAPGRDRPRPGRDHLPAAAQARRADRDRIRPRPDHAADGSVAQGIGELTIIHKDVLKVDFSKLAGEGTRAPGRQPALQHLLADPVPCARPRRRRSRDMHFMLQKEVVDRMARRPGQQGLRPPERDAAGRLPGDAAVRRPAGGVPAAAEGRFGGGAPGAASLPARSASHDPQLFAARGARRLRPAPQDPAQCRAAGLRRRRHRGRGPAPGGARRAAGGRANSSRWPTTWRVTRSNPARSFVQCRHDDPAARHRRRCRHPLPRRPVGARGRALRVRLHHPHPQPAARCRHACSAGTG